MIVSFFLGFKNQSELPRYYNLSDFLVLPSKFETWGFVVNEAMNAAKAVVLSDRVGAAVDLVDDGKNGFIYQSGNITQLASVISKLCQDSQMCIDMGEFGRQKISSWSYQEQVNSLRTVLL